METKTITKKSPKKSKEAFNIVAERAGHYCEVCGLPEQSDMAFHHRKLRSRGGKDTASNLVRIHHGCHNLNTNSIHLNPKASLEKGHMVPSWAEPEDYGFAKPDGTVVLLQNDGTVILKEEGV